MVITRAIKLMWSVLQSMLETVRWCVDTSIEGLVKSHFNMREKS